MKKTSRVKKVLLSLASGLVVAATSAGLVYAWSNAQGKVSGFSVTVGSNGLLINGVQEWLANLHFTNITPGWTSNPITFTVQNVSKGTNFFVSGRILVAGGDLAALNNTLLMAVQEVGSPTPPDFQTINWWNSSTKILAGGLLPENTSRDYQIILKLPTTAGDEVQNKEVGLSLLLTGVQTP